MCDLVSLRKVGIEVMLASKLTAQLDRASEPKASARCKHDGFAVKHW